MNDQIDVPEVRVIDGEGGQLGIMSIEEALEQSDEAGMDLVEVSPKANPVSYTHLTLPTKASV